MLDAFATPLLLPLGPLAVLLLWLLERWRQRPVRVVVADVGLFALTPEVEAEARARRRRVGLRFLLLALAALLLGLAAAGPRGPRPPDGPVVVDLVLDRGVTSGVIEADGATRLEHHRRALRAALDALRKDDRARVHLVPGERATTPLTPDAARALLDAALPTAAHADVEAVLARLPGDAAKGDRAPPVIVATDRALAVPEPLEPRLLVARAGGPRSDRGVVALARGDDGALHASIASYGAPGPARVRFTARAATGGEASAVRDVVLPERGVVRATWDDAPADALEATATLEGQDALPSDDRAFAVVAPPRRRVALAGDPGDAVRRALAAVPGTELTEVPLGAVGLAGEAFDLVVLVTSEPPIELPRTAVVTLPPALPRAGRLQGGEVHALDHPAFRHTLREVARAPFRVEALAPIGSGQREDLLRVGAHPLVAVRGAGRELVVTITAPLAPDVTDWTRHDAFPLFWGELLALAAPRGRGTLAAHTAGRPWTGPLGATLVPLQVARIEGHDGAPLLGTVAAPPEALAQEVAPQALPADLAERLDACRRPGPRTALAPLLAALALALLLTAWSMSSSAAARSGGRAADPARAPRRPDALSSAP